MLKHVPTSELAEVKSDVLVAASELGAATAEIAEIEGGAGEEDLADNETCLFRALKGVAGFCASRNSEVGKIDEDDEVVALALPPSSPTPMPPPKRRRREAILSCPGVGVALSGSFFFLACFCIFRANKSFFC